MRHLLGGIALVATSLALSGVVLARRHGYAAVREVTRKHNEAHPRGGLVREAMTLSGQIAQRLAQRRSPLRATASAEKRRPRGLSGSRR